MMRAKKLRSKVSKQEIPGYFCFSLNPNGSSRQRASYSNERREEVKDIRKAGACLRCQLLKKPCSRGDPCDRCIKATAKNSSSRCLAWMDCVRPNLQKLSIYGSDSSNLKDLALGGVPVLQYFAEGDVQLKCDIPFQWNIDELSSFLAGWLVADQESSTAASMVGIMSSASLYSTLSTIIGPEHAQIFKVLICTSSLLHNTGGKHSIGIAQSHDIKVIRYCGGRVLRYLESQLRPTRLAKLTQHNLYAVFLLLLGTAIATNYCDEALCVNPTTGQGIDDEINPATELIKLLSHYIIYIGQQTGLIDSSLHGVTTRGLLLFETRKPHPTWESTDHFRSILHDNSRISENSNSKSAEMFTEARFEYLSPLSLPSYIDALPCLETVSWRYELSSLDAAAVHLVKSSDSDMIADQSLSKQEATGTGLRKDSLGSDLIFDEELSQISFGEKLDTDLPTMGISSIFFDMDETENWPCLNRIPSPDSVELDGVVEELSLEDMLQGALPIKSCGILPSCTSSGPSACESPSGSA